MLPDRQKRLSSWRRVAYVGDPSPTPGFVEDDARVKQERVATLFLSAVPAHQAFAAALKAAVQQDGQDPELQQRVTDFAALLFRGYEEATLRILQQAAINIVEDFPREVVRIQKEYVEPPPRNWWERLLRG